MCQSPIHSVIPIDISFESVRSSTFDVSQYDKHDRHLVLSGSRSFQIKKKKTSINEIIYIFNWFVFYIHFSHIDTNAKLVDSVIRPNSSQYV